MECAGTQAFDVLKIRKSGKAGSLLTKLSVVIPIFIAPLIAGCASMKTPERLYAVNDEMADIKSVLSDPVAVHNMSTNYTKRDRNNIITARKYAIDVQYTTYEAALTHEAQMLDFGAKAANIALTTTANLIPVAHTSNMLNEIGVGTLTLDDAYNEKILRAQIIQDIQASMRTARHDQAAVIYANMKCSLKSYPMAMALSDLESYYRAGTAPAGLIKLTQTVTKAETDAKATEDSQKPASPNADAQIAANATEAAVKNTNAKNKAPKCKVDTSGE
ncbi:MAG TPA: hypothetical protein VGC38_01810 [Pseudolabrys sp.]